LELRGANLTKMKRHTAVRGWTRQEKWKEGDPVRSIIACKADMELIVDVSCFERVLDFPLTFPQCLGYDMFKLLKV
jgi:hypothetical protein